MLTSGELRFMTTLKLVPLQLNTNIPTAPTLRLIQIPTASSRQNTGV